jgi:hypothetical protein
MGLPIPFWGCLKTSSHLLIAKVDLQWSFFAVFRLAKPWIFQVKTAIRTGASGMGHPKLEM